MPKPSNPGNPRTGDPPRMSIDALALIRFRTINPPGEEEAFARHLGRLNFAIAGEK